MADCGRSGIVGGIQKGALSLGWKIDLDAGLKLREIFRKALRQELIALCRREPLPSLDLAEFIGLAVAVGQGVSGADFICLGYKIGSFPPWGEGNTAGYDGSASGADLGRGFHADFILIFESISGLPTEIARSGVARCLVVVVGYDPQMGAVMVIRAFLFTLVAVGAVALFWTPSERCTLYIPSIHIGSMLLGGC
jgi:hypothetical protein